MLSKTTAGSIAALFLLTGCSSISIDDAKKLAATGLSASSAAMEKSQDVKWALEDAPRYEQMKLGLIGQSAKLSTEDLDNIKAIHAHLESRVSLAKSLETFYRAFDNLANYDAAGEVEGALNSTISSFNSFQNALRPGSQLISPVAGEVINIGGGILAGEAQKRQLSKSSEIVRKPLSKYVALARSESQAAKSLLKNYSHEKFSVTKLLWDRGVLSARGAFLSAAQQAGGYGLISEEKGDFTSKNKSISRQAIINDLDLQSRISDEAINESYDAYLGVLDQLIDAHLQFEAGRKFDANLMLQYVNDLKRYANRISVASRTK